MKGNPIFYGAATALITPFDENGVDYKALEGLINRQIESGIDALVICGTTGESSTLSESEYREVLDFAVRTAASRVPMIAGTGANDTRKAVERTKYACEIGYNAALVVTPYYNKATQHGLVAMYNAIADASSKPLILYNVPSRTGVNIEPETYLELAKHPRIAAIKEANGDISKIAQTMELVGDALTLYSGNDDQIVPIMSLGGMGVISVLSNVAPKETVEICQKFFDGDIRESTKMQLKLLPLIKLLFCEVNPIPVKAAVAAMGFCKNILRLPLTCMETEHYKKLMGEMRRLGIEV